MAYEDEIIKKINSKDISSREELQELLNIMNKEYIKEHNMKISKTNADVKFCEAVKERISKDIDNKQVVDEICSSLMLMILEKRNIKEGVKTIIIKNTKALEEVKKNTDKHGKILEEIEARATTTSSIIEKSIKDRNSKFPHKCEVDIKEISRVPNYVLPFKKVSLNPDTDMSVDKLLETSIHFFHRNFDSINRDLFQENLDSVNGYLNDYCELFQSNLNSLNREICAKYLNSNS